VDYPSLNVKCIACITRSRRSRSRFCCEAACKKVGFRDDTGDASLPSSVNVSVAEADEIGVPSGGILPFLLRGGVNASFFLAIFRMAALRTPEAALVDGNPDEPDTPAIGAIAFRYLTSFHITRSISEIQKEKRWKQDEVPQTWREQHQQHQFQPNLTMMNHLVMMVHQQVTTLVELRYALWLLSLLWLFVWRVIVLHHDEQSQIQSICQTVLCIIYIAVRSFTSRVSICFTRLVISRRGAPSSSSSSSRVIEAFILI
jgi:hypothetical protein